jgi:Cu(I)/Ag(I) efflux system protein CusF
MKRIATLAALAAFTAISLAQAELTDGEIRKVDKESNRITIAHAPIPTLDMPAMTMAFQVRDKAVLERFKAGDKVRFAAEKLDGKHTVVRIELAK